MPCQAVHCTHHNAAPERKLNILSNLVTSMKPVVPPTFYIALEYGITNFSFEP
jgi:hypothetical protein